MEPLSTAFLTSDAADGHAENDKDEEREHHKDGRHGDDGDVIGGARSRGVLGSGGRGCGRDTCLGEGREGERLKSTIVRDNLANFTCLLQKYLRIITVCQTRTHTPTVRAKNGPVKVAIKKQTEKRWRRKVGKEIIFILITIFWGGVVLAEIAGIAFHVVLETAVVPLVESVAAKLKVLVATDELVGMRRWTVEDVVTATGVEVAESLVSRAARDVALAFGAFRAWWERS